MTDSMKGMSVPALVRQFESVGERLSKVMFELVSPLDMPGRDEYVTESEQLYAELKAIDAELRTRGREARLALTQLYDSPILEVRLEAAHYTLGVAPKAARAQLEDIAKTGWLEGISARTTIRALDSGRFKPD